MPRLERLSTKEGVVVKYFCPGAKSYYSSHPVVGFNEGSIVPSPAFENQFECIPVEKVTPDMLTAIMEEK